MHLDLSKNFIGDQVEYVADYLSAQNIAPPLNHLNLAENEIRQIPKGIGKLTNLRYLNLSNNKIRSLNIKQDESCMAQLKNLEELYLNQNRLKDMPTVFQNFYKLRILGTDWFFYIARSLFLPKVVDRSEEIFNLQEGSKRLAKKGNHTMTFKQFAECINAVPPDGEYDIDGGHIYDDDGRTSLHKAVLKNDQAMVQNLLREGADPNIHDSYGMSALTLAFNQNHQSICKIIMKMTNKIDFSSGENSNLILHAVDKLDFEMLKQLLQLGCDPNMAIEAKSGEYCLHLLMYKMCYSRIPDYLKNNDDISDPG